MIQTAIETGLRWASSSHFAQDTLTSVPVGSPSTRPSSKSPAVPPPPVSGCSSSPMRHRLSDVRFGPTTPATEVAPTDSWDPGARLHPESLLSQLCMSTRNRARTPAALLAVCVDVPE
jgi:hypothetical protein